MAQAAAAANRILSFRIRPKTGERKDLEMRDTEGGVRIEFRDCWFKYPTRDIPIFQGLNLTVCFSFLSFPTDTHIAHFRFPRLLSLSIPPLSTPKQE